MNALNGWKNKVISTSAALLLAACGGGGKGEISQTFSQAGDETLITLDQIPEGQWGLQQLTGGLASADPKAGADISFRLDRDESSWADPDCQPDTNAEKAYTSGLLRGFSAALNLPIDLNKNAVGVSSLRTEAVYVRVELGDEGRECGLSVSSGTASTQLPSLLAIMKENEPSDSKIYEATIQGVKVRAAVAKVDEKIYLYYQSDSDEIGGVAKIEYTRMGGATSANQIIENDLRDSFVKFSEESSSLNNSLNLFVEADRFQQGSGEPLEFERTETQLDYAVQLEGADRMIGLSLNVHPVAGRQPSCQFDFPVETSTYEEVMSFEQHAAARIKIDTNSERSPLQVKAVSAHQITIFNSYGECGIEEAKVFAPADTPLPISLINPLFATNDETLTTFEFEDYKVAYQLVPNQNGQLELTVKSMKEEVDEKGSATIVVQTDKFIAIEARDAALPRTEKEIDLTQDENEIVSTGVTSSDSIFRDPSTGRKTVIRGKSELKSTIEEINRTSSKNNRGPMYSVDAATHSFDIAKKTGGSTRVASSKEDLEVSILDILALIKDKMNTNNDDLELVFNIDYSGSMRDDIEGVIEGLTEVTRSLDRIIASGRSVRVGITTFGETGKEKVELALTSSMSQVRSTLSRLLDNFRMDNHADDPGEACYSGINCSIQNLRWSSSNKSIIVITDEGASEAFAGRQDFINKVMAEAISQNIDATIYSILVPTRVYKY